MKKITPYQRVLAHKKTVIEQFGPEPEMVSTVLALIHIESSGRPKAISATGSFYGLLQIGEDYLKDACKQAGKPAFHPRELVGDAGRSIWACSQYMIRYQDRHEWNPDRMAFGHKTGAGTLGKVARGELKIDDFKKWDTDKYMAKFRAAYPAYLAEITKGACA